MPACEYNLKVMLALSETDFDQGGVGGGRVGGWREVAQKPGCELAAAELIATYRTAHPNAGGLLAFHEGQLYAKLGDYHRAIRLILESRRPRGVDLGPAWDPYVDATVAFLRGDWHGLLTARKRLLGVLPSSFGLPPARAGYVKLPSANGRPATKVRWPPNIDVVNGLIRCFGKPYNVAYSQRCGSDGTIK